MTTVKFKGTKPTKATQGAAGYDLYSATADILHQGDRILVNTNTFIELPLGYEAQVRPRSGLAWKHGVTVLNAPGTIDSDYRGEIKVMLINHGSEAFSITEGMRIAQLVIAPVTSVDFEEVQQLDATKRQAGGFGSTGV